MSGAGLKTSLIALTGVTASLRERLVTSLCLPLPHLQWILLSHSWFPPLPTDEQRVCRWWNLLLPTVFCWICPDKHTQTSVISTVIATDLASRQWLNTMLLSAAYYFSDALRVLPHFSNSHISATLWGWQSIKIWVQSQGWRQISSHICNYITREPFRINGASYFISEMKEVFVHRCYSFYAGAWWGWITAW